MKFKSNIPMHGEERTVRRFLFFPRTLRVKDRSKYVTRWLEFAEIEQRGFHGYWSNSCWGDI